jgi:hypothetical protein
LADPSLHYDAGQLEQTLAPEFFRLRIRDQGTLAETEITESRYPPELIVGRFVRLMKERLAAARASGSEEDVQIETQALQLGLALLEKREVL